MNLHDLPTPALVVDLDRLRANIATMAATWPGTSLRPHVKAHKCTALAAEQHRAGHTAFTVATPREAAGMVAAGLGSDLLLANEVLDADRLAVLAGLEAEAGALVTVAVDSPETVDAAVRAGLRSVVVDVNVGLPRCGCRPDDAGRIADLARGRGLVVRGVMGYEGHLMVMDDREQQRAKVAQAVATLAEAHHAVGGSIVSMGGTGTFDLHAPPGTGPVTELQAGSYALMDTYYGHHGHPFEQAVHVYGTVISANPKYAVADVGLKSMGMDHGNPMVELLDGRGADVWFLSDEHVTFAPHEGVMAVGDRVRLPPAHVDPTMAMHEVAFVVQGHEVVDRWPIDLRNW